MIKKNNLSINSIAISNNFKGFEHLLQQNLIFYERLNRVQGDKEGRGLRGTTKRDKGDSVKRIVNFTFFTTLVSSHLQFVSNLWGEKRLP